MTLLNRIVLIGLTTHLCCTIANAQKRNLDMPAQEKSRKNQLTDTSDNVVKGGKQNPEFEGWDFGGAEALAVHGHYGPEDFYKLNRETRYVSTHLGEFVPTATVGRQGPVSEFEMSILPEISAVVAQTDLGKLTLDEYIKATELQGIIVLHHGRIVYERYPRMHQTDKHIYFSISKVLVSTAVGILQDDGKLDPRDPISKYLPQLSASGWADVKVIDILNMTTGMTGLQFDDPAAQTDSTNSYYMFASHMGLTKKTSACSIGIWDILRSMKKQKEPGVAFEYSSVNTVLLSLLVEQISGQRFATFVTERIWKKISAEADGYIGLSTDGLASSSAMMNSTLRDLARFGLLFTPSWQMVSKEQVVSPAHLRRIVTHGAFHSAYDKGVMGRNIIKATGEIPEHNSYQWDAVMADGDFFKSGFNGQGLYISPSKDLVIACFAHSSGSSVGYLRAIAESRLFNK